MNPAGEASLLELVVNAGRAKSREEWLFLLVNRTVAVAGYDRASAWNMNGIGAGIGGPALLAVSGAAVPDGEGAFASAWKPALKSLGNPGAAGPIGPETVADAVAWREAEAIVAGNDADAALSALWIPAAERGIGFVFERWGKSFSEAERLRLERFVDAASLARAGGGKVAPALSRKRLIRLGVCAAALLALVLIRLPLRIAAECEVAARNPRLVAAPMPGVIAEVVAEPGARVAAGTPLAVYDSRMMEEELNVLRRQVGVAEAELATARARGFAEQRYRAETALLEARLEQEGARLRALETRYAQRVIAAPVAGMIQLDDPRAWRGRPVATGEAILWLVEPADTRVKIWLPQDDRIDFDPERLLGVHLYALGGESRAAKLTYVSTFAQPVGDGRYAFPAEAEWADEGAGGNGTRPPPLGLRGTAFLYGENVSLGYWLIRRPLGWLRRWTGV